MKIEDYEPATRVADILGDHLMRLATEVDHKTAILAAAVDWFEVHRPDWGPGTLPTWYVDASAALQAKRDNPK